MLRFALLFFFIASLDLGIEKVVREEKDWKRLLGEERHRVMRRKGTEPAFSGIYLHCFDEGNYSCAACGLLLFDSHAKYDAGNGWPSFRYPIQQHRVWIQIDSSLPFKSYEVLCRRCDSHLGHVFREKNGRLLRYTINSIALDFQLFSQKVDREGLSQK